VASPQTIGPRLTFVGIIIFLIAITLAAAVVFPPARVLADSGATNCGGNNFSHSGSCTTNRSTGGSVNIQVRPPGFTPPASKVYVPSD